MIFNQGYSQLRNLATQRLAVFALFTLTLLSHIPHASAEIPKDAHNIIERIAIQHNGRNKSFDSFARETLNRVTGSSQFEKEEPVETVLSIISFPDKWKDKPLISVPFVPLRESLGLDKKTQFTSYNDIAKTRTLMLMVSSIVDKQRKDEKLSMLDNETMDLYDRFAVLSALFEQDLHLVVPTSSIDKVWRSILKLDDVDIEQRDAISTGWEELISSIHENDGPGITAAASGLSTTLKAVNPAVYPASWRLKLEVIYNHASLFQIAWIAYFLVVVFLAVAGISASSRFAPTAGMTCLWLGFLVHASGIVVRMVLGGRPPVSNFYESVLWLPLAGVFIGFIIDRVYRIRYVLVATAFLGGVTLLLAGYLPLDSSISPVIAVLRSTLWLTIHVLTIMASYGALALAAVLAHIYGWNYLVKGSKHPALPSLGLVIYRIIQVGIVLLAAGIMLGAVWANASWGRYWGWDPKETWSLITLLWYLALLHGRFAGWIRGVGMALSTIGGFFLLLMTYYGVSFYLAGLHSYAGGHAKPLPILLVVYLVSEVLFMGIVGLAAFSHRQNRLSK